MTPIPFILVLEQGGLFFFAYERIRFNREQITGMSDQMSFFIQKKSCQIIHLVPMETLETCIRFQYGLDWKLSRLSISISILGKGYLTMFLLFSNILPLPPKKYPLVTKQEYNQILFSRLPIICKTILIVTMGVIYSLFIEMSHANIFECYDHRME